VNISPYYKAVIAGVSQIGIAVTGVVSLAELVPGDNAVAATVVGVGMSALAILGTVGTFLVRNEPAIETAVNEGVAAGEDVWRELRAIKDHQARTPTPLVEPYKAVAPTAQPVSTAPAVTPINVAVSAATAVEDVAAALARYGVR
jgi:hypothetical protein